MVCALTSVLGPQLCDSWRALRKNATCDEAQKGTGINERYTHLPYSYSEMAIEDFKLHPWSLLQLAEKEDLPPISSFGTAESETHQGEAGRFSGSVRLLIALKVLQAIDNGTDLWKCLICFAGVVVATACSGRFQLWATGCKLIWRFRMWAVNSLATRVKCTVFASILCLLNGSHNILSIAAEVGAGVVTLLRGLQTFQGCDASSASSEDGETNCG